MREFQSAEINELATALAKAQSEMGHAGKSVDNAFFKSKYADLPAVIDAARACLSKNGLSVIQVTDFDEHGKLLLVTQLNHASGQWVRSWYPVSPVKSDPQSFGSALTYARRYSFAALTGVAAVGEDDDGNAASGRQTGGTSIPAQVVTHEQAVEIDQLLTSTSSDKKLFLDWLGVDDVRKTPADKYDDVMKQLGRKLKKAAV